MYIYHTKQFIIQKLYYMCICTDRKELVTIVNFWRNVCYICTLNMNRITIRFSMCHAVFISIYFTKSIHQYNYIGSYKLPLALVVSVSVYALKYYAVCWVSKVSLEESLKTVGVSTCKFPILFKIWSTNDAYISCRCSLVGKTFWKISLLTVVGCMWTRRAHCLIYYEAVVRAGSWTAVQ